jgi:hypothetical protein
VVRSNGVHAKEFGLYPASNQSYEGFLSRGETNFFFLAVLGFELGAFTLSHSISPLFVCV